MNPISQFEGPLARVPRVPASGPLSAGNEKPSGSPTDIAPAFTDQPDSVSVAEGAATSFAVVVTGTPTPTLQWYKNGVAIPGATNAAYNIASADFADDGADFYCRATNTAGSTNSTHATLTVVGTIPGTPLGVWYPDQYHAASRSIPNAMSVSAPSTNLLRFPRHSLVSAISGFWASNGATLTNVADSAGNTAARRAVLTGAAGSRFVTSSSFPFAAATTYTIVVKAKSGVAGVAQTMPIGGNGLTAFQLNVSVGDTWTRYANTFTTVGAVNAPVGVCWSTAGAGCTVDIESIEVYQANADPGAPVLDGRLYLDRYGNQNIATVGSGVVTFPTGSAGYIQFPYATTGTPVVYSAVMRRPPTLAGLTGQHGVICEGVGEDTNVFSQYENAGRPSKTNSVYLQNSGGSEPYRGYDYDTLGYTVVSIKWSNSVAQVFFNGRMMYSTNATTQALILRNLRLGTYSGTAHTYPYGPIVIHKEDLTATQIAKLAKIMRARAIASGITMGPIPRVIMHEGDSITGEQDYCYGWHTARQLNEFAIATLYSSGGAVIGTGNIRLQHLLDQIASILANGDDPPIVTVGFGTNDLTSESAASFTAKLITYCDTLRAAGAKVVVPTILPRTTNINSGVVDTTFNGKRFTVNNSIRAFPGVHADAIVDHDLRPYGADNACINVVMFYDGWHPTAATQGTMITDFIAAINPLL